jgi:hypothetical protein
MVDIKESGRRGDVVARVPGVSSQPKAETKTDHWQRAKDVVPPAEYWDRYTKRYLNMPDHRDESTDPESFDETCKDVQITPPRLLHFSPDSLSKIDRGAQATLAVSCVTKESEFHSSTSHNHVLGFLISWKPKKVFGRIITAGRFDVPIGTPAALHLSVKIAPPDRSLQKLIYEMVSRFLLKQGCPLVGPPRPSGSSVEMLAEVLAGFDVDWSVNFMKRLLIAFGGDSVEARESFAGKLDELCPPQRPKKKGIMRQSISGAEFLSNLRDIASQRKKGGEPSYEIPSLSQRRVAQMETRPVKTMVEQIGKSEGRQSSLPRRLDASPRTTTGTTPSSKVGHPEYEGFLQALEELKTRGKVTDEVYLKLKKEYKEKLAKRGVKRKVARIATVTKKLGHRGART